MSALVLIALLTVAGAEPGSVEAEFSSTLGGRQVVVEAAYATVEIIGRPGARVNARYVLPENYEAPKPLLAISKRSHRIVVGLHGVERPGVRLVIEVPERTDLGVIADNGGPVVVSGVAGEIDILNSNAGVELRGVSGSASIATSNGPIIASFDEVELGRPMSFVTSNGRIEVAMPTSLAADVYLETDNGELASDFEIRADGGIARDRIERRGGRLKVTREGAIGGGGVRYRFLTDNDSIRLRARR